MEILIHKDTGCCGRGYISFVIHRNGFNDVKPTDFWDSEFQITIQREGYVRKISSLRCYIHGQSEHKFLQDFKTTKKQLFSLFGISGTQDSDYIVKNIDPWICFTDNLDLMLYFGDDKPVRKEKL